MSRLVARVVVRLRFVLVPLWALIAVFAITQLPALGEEGGSVLDSSSLDLDAPEVQAELLSKTQFALPLVGRTVVVHDNRTGLPPDAVRDAAALARDVAAGQYPELAGLVAVVPYPSTLFEPGLRTTTVLYSLQFLPGVGVQDSEELARRFAEDLVPAGPGDTVGVTGTSPATAAQGNVLLDRLTLVELATVVLVVVAIAVFFGSVVAPLVNLAAVAVAYAAVTGALGWAGGALDIAVPPEIEPVVVVLVFGVVTDYAVFFLDHTRRYLREGMSGLQATTRAAGEVNGIVAVAGLVVALSCAALAVADLPFFRAFGPALAVSVLTSALVAITLVPCLLALLGRWSFWPSVRGPAAPRPTSTRRPVSARIAHFAAHQPVAAAVGSLLLLAVASLGLTRYEIGNPVIQSLPADSAPRQAYDTAAAGFAADGIIAPTIAVVRGEGVAERPDELAALGLLLAREPGVAAVFGPQDVPPDVEQLAGGAFTSPRGDLARYLVVPAGDPLDGPAVRAVSSVIDRAPELLQEAGLPDAELLVGGDTAVSARLVDGTVDDLRKVAPLALLAAFLVLAVYLRALVAPLYLTLTSVLAVLAALGLTTMLSPPSLEPAAVSFFVPFAAAVLLLGLGSDYNVLLVGRIWAETKRRPLREAVEVASAEAARPIATAGIILAASFGLLALVPLAMFRDIALVMVIGLLLDAFLVRQLLVPALIVLVGPVSGWPGRRLGRREGPDPATADERPGNGGAAGTSHAPVGPAPGQRTGSHLA